LLACTREVWDNLGGFDVETFGKFDYEDIDLSVNALSKGYELLALNFPKHLLRHLSGVTICSLNIDRMKITQGNRLRFIEKWQSKFGEIYNTLESMKNDGAEK
jgi:GT2 family glycosyltransferase